MSILRNRTIFEVAQGIKAFFSLEAGITRGQVPSSETLAAQARDLAYKLKEAQEQLDKRNIQLRRVRQRTSERARRIVELERSAALRNARAPRRLVNGDRQASAGLEGTVARGEELMPPENMIFPGDKESFGPIGERFLSLFIEAGELQPHDRVLDIGSGIGRMALPLTRYLKRGSYEGFDIMRNGVEWCQKNITPRHPNFRFQLSDVYNKNYNPDGRFKASEYRFPYGDESFDFVFLTSVFTHMLPDDLENYLSEIARVLRCGGRCFSTFFLLNEQSMKLMEAGEAHLDFKYELEGCRTVNEAVPEAAIAYEESAIRDLYEKYDLDIVEPIHYGRWCGREQFLDGQDIIVATKGGPHILCNCDAT